MTAEQLTAQYLPLPPEAKRQVDDFLAFIGQKYAPETPTPARVRGVPEKSYSASQEQSRRKTWP